MANITPNLDRYKNQLSTLYAIKNSGTSETTDKNDENRFNLNDTAVLIMNIIKEEYLDSPEYKKLFIEINQDMDESQKSKSENYNKTMEEFIYNLGVELFEIGTSDDNHKQVEKEFQYIMTELYQKLSTVPEQAGVGGSAAPVVSTENVKNIEEIKEEIKKLNMERLKILAILNNIFSGFDKLDTIDKKKEKIKELTVGDLKKRIDTYLENIKTIYGQLRQKMKETVENLSKVSQQHETRQSNDAQPLQELQKSLEIEEKIQKLKYEHAAQIRTIEDELERKKKLLKNHEIEEDKLIIGLKKKIEDCNKSVLAKTKEIQEEKLKLQKILEDLDKKLYDKNPPHDFTLENIKKSIEADLDKLIAERDELQKVNELNNRALEAATTKEKKLTSSIDTLNDKILELERIKKEEINDLQSNLQGEIKKLETKLAFEKDFKEKAIENSSRLSTELSDAKVELQRIKDLETQLAAAQAQAARVSQLEQELSAAQAQAEESKRLKDEGNSSSKTRVTELQQELASAQAQAARVDELEQELAAAKAQSKQLQTKLETIKELKEMITFIYDNIGMTGGKLEKCSNGKIFNQYCFEYNTGIHKIRKATSTLMSTLMKRSTGLYNLKRVYKGKDFIVQYPNNVDNYSLMFYTKELFYYLKKELEGHNSMSNETIGYLIQFLKIYFSFSHKSNDLIDNDKFDYIFYYALFGSGSKIGPNSIKCNTAILKIYKFPYKPLLTLLSNYCNDSKFSHCNEVNEMNTNTNTNKIDINSNIIFPDFHFTANVIQIEIVNKVLKPIIPIVHVSYSPDPERTGSINSKKTFSGRNPLTQEAKKIYSNTNKMSRSNLRNAISKKFKKPLGTSLNGI